MTLTRRRINDIGFLVLLLAAAVAVFVAIQWSRDQAAGEPPAQQVASNAVVNDLPSLDVSRSSMIDQTIANLQARLADDPEDQGSLARLGLAFLQRARDVADPTYYVKAEQALTQANELNGDDYVSLIGLGTLALARHDFAAALEWGEHAAAANPDSPAAFGVIADAQTELGDYDAAVAAVQTMVDLRPDLSSYARVSYQRELRGDGAGAVEAMQQAVVAGSGLAENEAWTRVELGNLYLGQGDLVNASREFEQALARVPDYPRALGGLGRVAAARGDFPAAVAHYTAATAVVPLPELVIGLGDVYEASGRTEDARKQFDLVAVVQQLQQANGVNADLELALFDLDHGRNLVPALEAAKRSYDVRKSIYGADVLAWAYFKNGMCAEAAPYAREAMKLGTRDGLILFHAGMVAECNGDEAGALAYFEQALEANPSFSVRFAPVARAKVAELKGAAQ